MEEQHRLSKCSYKFSIESLKSNRSSCRSLERPSWCERENSLSKKHSLVEVMSLEGGRKSDLFDQMIHESCEPILGRQSVGGQTPVFNYETNYNELHNNYQFSYPPYLNPRKSEETNRNVNQALGHTINHTCTCYTQCQWQKCGCFQAKDQICIKGFCCVGCIEMKQKLFQGTLFNTSNQHNHVTLYCTCKKTKCNKKYCSCFAAGVHCGLKCSCEGCINCPRKSQDMQIESQRESINMQELAKMNMPQSMDFEPVQFRTSNT